MMNDITIYFGLSGSFKGTTISTMDGPVMRSAIKPWKHYQFGSFKGLIPESDLLYGILHLVRLEEFLMGDGEKGIVERSISDCLFYNNNSDEFNGNPLSDERVKELIKEEEALLEGRSVKKVLLIQRDENFVRDVILKEPTRQKTFKGDPQYYMALQDKYVEWTKKYNVIDEEIVIEDAKSYLEDVLGVKYNLGE